MFWVYLGSHSYLDDKGGPCSQKMGVSWGHSLGKPWLVGWSCGESHCEHVYIIYWLKIWCNLVLFEFMTNVNVNFKIAIFFQAGQGFFDRAFKCLAIKLSAASNFLSRARTKIYIYKLISLISYTSPPAAFNQTILKRQTNKSRFTQTTPIKNSMQPITAYSIYA